MNTDDLTLFTAKTKTKKLIDSINHINNKFDEIALSQLKQSILLEVHAAINQKIISIPCLHKQISDFFLYHSVKLIDAVLGKDTVRRSV